MLDQTDEEVKEIFKSEWPCYMNNRHNYIVSCIEGYNYNFESHYTLPFFIAKYQLFLTKLFSSQLEKEFSIQEWIEFYNKIISDKKVNE